MIARKYKIPNLESLSVPKPRAKKSASVLGITPARTQRASRAPVGAFAEAVSTTVASNKTTSSDKLTPRSPSPGTKTVSSILSTHELPPHLFPKSTLVSDAHTADAVPDTDTLLNYISSPKTTRNLHSSVYKGTVFEYAAKAALGDLGMRLRRCGGGGDGGVDLKGWWWSSQGTTPHQTVPSAYILGQCKNHMAGPCPEHVRSLIGAVLSHSHPSPPLATTPSPSVPLSATSKLPTSSPSMSSTQSFNFNLTTTGTCPTIGLLIAPYQVPLKPLSKGLLREFDRAHVGLAIVRVELSGLVRPDGVTSPDTIVCKVRSFLFNAKAKTLLDVPDAALAA